MACGNSLLTSPVYNKDGILRFENNRVKAFHLGLSGQFNSEWSARVLMSNSWGWGRHYLPFLEVKENLSSLFEVNYSPIRSKDWLFSFSIAGDKGRSGNNLGLNMKIRKKGVLVERRKR